MEIARRLFLQFAAGAVGGALVSPLPWKLADDTALWSQNWSFRPSPERGEITDVSSVCTLCEGGCGIQARLVNGHRAIGIRGNPKSPLNDGSVCSLCCSGLQFFYAPYRISEPMIQRKARGDLSGFEKISWDSALSELAKRLSQLRSDKKPHAAACITSARKSSMDALWAQFFKAYGSPNLFKMPSSSDSLKTAAGLTAGENSPFSFAIEDADYVLNFGADLFEGGFIPSRAQYAVRRWMKDGKNSSPLVQIESRCSMTASKAAKWVAVAPGAEPLLAMGVAHVMVKEGLYDAEFVKSSVFGFEDWTDKDGMKRQGFKSVVSSNAYSPEEIAKKTGVDAAKIRELAKEFVSKSRPVAIWGTGQPDMPNNTYHDLVFLALNALKGNLKPGGTITPAPEVPLAALPEVEQDALAERGIRQQRLDIAKSKNIPFPENGLYGFLDAMASGNPYQIEMLMLHEANPAFSLPETKLFHSAAAKVPFLVSFSSFKDESWFLADLVLPNHAPLERLDDVIGVPGAPYAYYAVSAPILPPQLKTRDTGTVILQTAKTLGGTVAASLPWESYEAYLKFRVEGLAQAQKGAVADKAGIDLAALKPGQSPAANFKDGAELWKKLKAGNCWYDAPAAFPETFKTASGKFELACQSLLEKGIKADDELYLPHYAPLAPSGSEKDLPLLLVGRQSPSIPGGYLATPPFMTKTIPDTVLREKDAFVEINPETALLLGLAQGDLASLRTTQAEVTVRVNLSPGARPGIIYMPRGLGHRAYDEYIQDKGANANNLMEVQLDPVTGMGTVWATRAQLRRA